MSPTQSTAAGTFRRRRSGSLCARPGRGPEWAPSRGASGGTGKGAGLLRLALPLILSSSIWTLQATTDRVLLSYLGTEAVSTAVFSVMIFWTPLILFFNTASYS